VTAAIRAAATIDLGSERYLMLPTGDGQGGGPIGHGQFPWSLPVDAEK